MEQSETNSQFNAELLCPAKPGEGAPWAFIVLPREASKKLPRRGRTTVEASLNGHHFQVTLEPDGQLSHWLKVSKEHLEAAGVSVGDVVDLGIRPVDQEPEPEVPSDLQEALEAAPEARVVWNETTTIARLDWIHWIVSAKQAKTRTKRISDACDMLASGKRRVCCFDPSGYYSKALQCAQGGGHTGDWMSKPVVSSPLRRAFPLVAILLLTACDAPQLLPPDARLPDGSTYSGDIQDGYFHGEGVQEFASGMVYTGQFQEGYWHGDGELESPAGWHYEGEFQKGTMSGQGVIEDDGSRYEGEFRNGEFHGEGRYEAGGSVYIAEFEDGEPVEGKHVTDYGTYEGEFRDWYYHGEGSYAFTGESEDLGSLTGTWEFGEFVDQEEYVAEAPVPEEPALFTETILVEDRRRLNNQIESLAPEQAEAADAYFLAVGGDGTESVFMRDIQVAKTGLQAQFDVENRAIMLLNHRDYETFPLATRPSIASALEALDAQMNPEEDLLVVHLVSHGMQNGQLLLQQPGIELPNLSPQDFAEMLEPLNVRRKLLVISACYSGQWIEPLKDEDTLIMTSARADRTSFGCGDDSEMTWFTKAVYQSVGLSLADPDAMFEDINQQIRTWEEEIGMEESNWSYPQSHVGENLRKWLSQMSQTTP